MIAPGSSRRDRLMCRGGGLPWAGMVALIASDLDGTLLASDGTVGARTGATLARLEDAGLHLVLVTGRPPRWMRPITEQIEHRGVAVCANGGLVLDLATSEILRAHPFADGDGLEVLRALRDRWPDLVFGVEWPDGFAHETGYPRGTRSSELVPNVVYDVADVRQLFDRPVIKLLARIDAGEVDGFAAEARELLGATATVTHSSIGLLEISAPGVTKASALASIAEERGVIAADVVAFGDMPNDLPMLAWAGRAVAVANAHPEVLAVADEVTASNDEEGVADVIERLLDAV